MTKNTPTPWMISAVNDRAVVGFDENGTREVVAQCLSPADAAFVIRAANSHEALVKALRPLAAHADAVDAHFDADELAALDQETHLVAEGISIADCFRARAVIVGLE